VLRGWIFEEGASGVRGGLVVRVGDEALAEKVGGVLPKIMTLLSSG
jgi:hypothetical protein